MDESVEIILAVILSFVGFISIIIIICFIICYILRRKSKTLKTIKHRQQYQRSEKASLPNVINNKRKRRKKRFNTNDSIISLSFNPPHLINQNVKNLDKLFSNDLSLYYDDKQPINNRCYTNPITEPVYTSSSSLSSISTSISNIAVVLASYPQNQQFEFFNEFNHVSYIKRDQRLRRNPLRYSQSCRQRNDILPFDYYRSITPSISSSIENIFEPNYSRPINYSNATLMRKARLGQLRDDTAILY